MRKMRPGQIALSVIAVFALLALTGYTLFQCGVLNPRTLLTTAFASDVTLDDVLTAVGYVFRDETVLTQDTPSVSDSAVGSGEKVAAGSLVTCLYAAADETEASEKQEKLKALDDAIRFLARCTDTDGLKLSDADALRREAYAAYGRIMQASDAGRAEEASAAAKTLLEAMSRYNKLTGTSVGADGALSELRAERKALLGGQGTAYYSPASGYYFDVSSVDGYETVFHASGIVDRSADEIKRLFGASPVSVSGTVGKLVTGINWYFALPVSAAAGEPFAEGTRYFLTLRLSDGVKREVPMILEAKKTASDGEVILLFSCNRLSAELICCRRVEASVVIGSVSGYRVPNEALTERDGVMGVYVLDESTVRFRRIKVLARREGFSVVAARDPAEEEYRNYLNRNDRIILDGKDLYDGKQYG